MSRPGATPKSTVKNNSGTRVLVVEDFADNRDLLTEYLTFRGFAVTAAADGESALRSVREQRPDVILMDLRMPDISGIDTLIAIRSEFPEARVIMLTTFEGDVEIQRALEAGARGYLLKNMPPSD